MAQSKLFQYAVLYHPKESKDAAGNDTTLPSEIVVPLTTTLSSSQEQVAMKAARAVPEKFADKLDRVEIIVRPF